MVSTMTESETSGSEGREYGVEGFIGATLPAQPIRG